MTHPDKDMCFNPGCGDPDWEGPHYRKDHDPNDGCKFHTCPCVQFNPIILDDVVDIIKERWGEAITKLGEL